MFSVCLGFGLSVVIWGHRESLHTLVDFKRFVCLPLMPAAALDGGGVSASGSTKVLRLVAEAVISFDAFCFSTSAPPIPWLGQENERPWVDGGGIGVGGRDEV